MKKIVSETNFFFKIKRHSILKKPLLCGVSNGQDSSVLLIIFFHISKQLELDLSISYCHHFWHLQNFVSFSQSIKIGFIFKLPISIPLCEKKILLENEARVWRKTSLYRSVLLEKTTHFLLGHTFTDKIETILLHLIRGSSGEGLGNFDFRLSLNPQILEFQFPSEIIRIKKLNFPCIQTSSNKKLNYYATTKPVLYKRCIFLKIFKKKKIKVNDFTLKSSPKQTIFQKGISKKTKTENFILVIYLISKQITAPISEKLSWQVNNFISFSSFLKKTRRRKLTGKFLKYLLLQNNKTFSHGFIWKNGNSQIKFSRPLLTYSRTDILKIIEKYKLPVLNDQTNQLIKFSRNKIRYKLIPIIRFLFSKNFDYLLNNFFQITKSEQEYLEKIFQNFSFLFFFHLSFEKYNFLVSCNLIDSKKILGPRKIFLQKEGSGETNINTKQIFIVLSVGLQRKLLKKNYQEYTDNFLSFSNIENLRLYILKNLSSKFYFKE